MRDPAATAAERVCAHTVEMLVRATGHADDITLLAAQRVPVVPALDLALAASPSELHGTRQALGAWLTALGATEQDTFVLQHAIGELTTNAIEHAGSGTRVTLKATLTAAGKVVATVADQGAWRAPRRQPTRGRGLALTAQLVDSLHVTPSSTGTVAELVHTLRRPARLLGGFDGPPARQVSAEPAGRPTQFTITEQPGEDETRVRLTGPLDAATAATARQELLRRSRGGTVAMTVDLSGVTHLSSAGVSALHTVADRHAEQQAPLVLFAVPGSPAQYILDLVALPHTTSAPTATGATAIDATAGNPAAGNSAASDLTTGGPAA
jgi:anti-sigma regulatory factor (Ser/Thr protein kinase)/anti-anti-sigma regulatory factor